MIILFKLKQRTAAPSFEVKAWNNELLWPLKAVMRGVPFK